jgi:hypothetical protein
MFGSHYLAQTYLGQGYAGLPAAAGGDVTVELSLLTLTLSLFDTAAPSWTPGWNTVSEPSTTWTEIGNTRR